MKLERLQAALAAMHDLPPGEEREWETEGMRCHVRDDPDTGLRRATIRNADGDRVEAWGGDFPATERRPERWPGDVPFVPGAAAQLFVVEGRWVQAWWTEPPDPAAALETLVAGSLADGWSVAGRTDPAQGLPFVSVVLQRGDSARTVGRSVAGERSVVVLSEAHG